MNNVYLYYNEFNLGSLSFNTKYVWTPNIQEIKHAKEKYSLGMEMFMLPEKQTEFNEVPYHFKDFSQNATRDDLAKLAKIKESDNDFTKLLKLATLNYFIQEFVIKK